MPDHVTISDEHSLAIVKASQSDVAAFQSNCWSSCCKGKNWTKRLNTTTYKTIHIMHFPTAEFHQDHGIAGMQWIIGGFSNSHIKDSCYYTSTLYHSHGQ